jgi:hypothetical protein
MEPYTMSDRDKEWSFDDELFELRNWTPRRENLGPHWRSIASEIPPGAVESSIPDVKGDE